MLRSIKEMYNYKIHALDGDIGKVHEFFFDGRVWIVRYLVADTGFWLPGRKVLISRIALAPPVWDAQKFPVGLTKEQIENGPNIDTDKPVSRQHEIEMHEHYNWTPYWLGGGDGKVCPTTPLGKQSQKDVSEEQENDPQLRSTREVAGYKIRATDGEIGHVEDFIVDDEGWIIRYMVVDTRDWLPGKKVLIAPQWIERTYWGAEQVHVDLTKEAIKNCPEYHPSDPVNREYEIRMYDYYGQPKYWP
ncbi:MAG: PRC-barrel domain-containing protein [Anaerolineales bacterium]|nr:PRC-barrel domain-containing protein [Anaerolineales bacterium]